MIVQVPVVDSGFGIVGVHDAGASLYSGIEIDDAMEISEQIEI
jgi:hypothetical protein